jgi:hypothetical protein
VADRGGLDDATGPVDVTHGVTVGARDEHTAVGLAHQHPFGHELAQRLADGVAGDGQRGAHVLLREPLAGAQPPLHHLLAHRVGDPLGRGGPGDECPRAAEGGEGVGRGHGASLGEGRVSDPPILWSDC